MKKTKTYLLALAAATLTAMGALTACTDLPATDADAAGTDTDVPQGCIRISPDALAAPSFGTAAATRAAATDPTGRHTLIADGTAATRAASNIGTANPGKSAWTTGDRLTYVLLIETRAAGADDATAATPLFRITLNAEYNSSRATWAFATATDPVPTDATDPAAIATNGLRVERHDGTGTDATTGWTDMTRTYAGTVTSGGVLRLPPAVTDALDGGETVTVRMAVQYRSQAFTEITTTAGLTAGNLTTDAQAAYATGERWTLLPDDEPTTLDSGIGLTLKPGGTWLPTIANALRRLNAATTDDTADDEQAAVCYSRLRVATSPGNKVKMTVNTDATAANGGDPAIAFLPAGFDPWSGGIDTSGGDNTTLTFIATADAQGNAFFYGYPAKTTDDGNGIEVSTGGTDDFSTDALNRLSFTEGTTTEGSSADIKVTVTGQAAYTPEGKTKPIYVTTNTEYTVFTPSTGNNAWHLTGGEGTALDGVATVKKEEVLDASLSTITQDELVQAAKGGQTVWKLTGELTTEQLTTVKSALDEISRESTATLISLVLPGVTEIGDRAFHSVGNVENVVPGTDLITIGSYAFQSCTALTAVDLSGCTELETIGREAFLLCGSLTTIDLNGCTGLVSIGIYAFQQCTSLADIDLSGCTGLETINNDAFRDCTSLKSVTFGSAIKTWGIRVFNGVTTGNITLTLAPDQMQMTGNNYSSGWTATETNYFGSDDYKINRFCGYTFDKIEELGASASTPSAR